jgi:hypothetical protein
MISFKTSQADFDIINQIADRGWGLGWLRRSYENRMAMVMDITAVHANGNPLRLEGLLQADDFNFAHDISGICNCLDRQTGQLLNEFSPRYSRRVSAELPGSSRAGPSNGVSA